ncbi:3-hydroxyacyl-CoA dehydrogenase/enoyl-CoA hydratase/carnithine racemase [Streptosporangium becharense]|uniref:3-hydroxyacyl-CoA dehydrogenase/enoyl-CoA hydratase/carnithine racemase n=1 Tax=Streptosporangium becharense TaxID=1816182 RepID=A0A7W9MJ81_9ACTN|nr:3-hydroxyacyl-CoA dehydrogenase NAD-binding domain-containing protein [Streptosporangium becharense]MBB2911796.1 3-hydroxyacyl-CoA dehydrogenase/enoyl-CoA hydratase/carnithine racemase [Streptosporangium becharense]MBB5822386.1 3-hydroxyacyl-CoA dehydrogenase/enoyl-CoA hydratase/carnithine racemase [Streptosporangium becharense]
MTDIREIFRDEVVTRATVRDVELPYGAGTMALITLDNGFDHTKPSTFGPGGLTSLKEALDTVAGRTDLAAVGVVGKPFIFAVGADLKGAALIAEREQALQIGRLGHDVFRRLGELDVPSFAFVNGAAMGGGLEVALHCTYRTISSGVPAVALPECFLGLVPGWGGTQLLPRLIGPAAAIKLIVENPLAQNRTIKGPDAFALGVADAMFEPADFLEESLRWAARVLRGEVTVSRADHTGVDWSTTVADARALVDLKLRGASPAPYRALDLVELARTASRDEGFDAEDRALADLLMGDELRAGLYSFDLVQRRAKKPAGAPDASHARKVTKVGVVGAGLMASQMALLFARRLEVPVVLTDLDRERLDKGVGYVHAEVDKLLAKGRVSADQANRLKALVTGSLTKDAFSDADFVIEAVFEDMKVKKKVFAEVEEVVSAECVLATNTSSLSVTEMAAGLRHPERVVGFHFFNPVAVMPLLEIVRGTETDDAALATAFAVGRSLRKSSVLVKDAPAFVVNRLLTRFMGEVIGAVDEGTPLEVADHALDGLGLPMTPFALLQLVGPAVALHVAETLHEAFPSRYGVSENLARLVAAGKPGVYAPDFSLDPEAVALFSGGTSPSTAQEVRLRALRALAEEVRVMLDEGVVSAPQDIDLCMILGAGWPFHLGGVTPYLDRTGVAEPRFLSPGVASVPA